MKGKGIGYKEIVASGGKRSITATFLPLQITYDGKTKSIPRIDFPSSLTLSANSEHEKFPVLLILDVFPGKCPKKSHRCWRRNTFSSCWLPNNMTHSLQSLDLLVNGRVKPWLCVNDLHTDWFAEEIRAVQKSGVELESIEIKKLKMTLTVMEPLHARWLFELFNIMTTDQWKKAIISGWEVPGISEAIKIGLSQLPSLDLFSDISIGEENIDFVVNQSFPGKEDPNVNACELDDDIEESEWEDEKKYF